MIWEAKSLNQIGEADVHTLIDTGLEEHLQLEYKSALYDATDRGKREFLLDVCMFANTTGGILLIGIPERRDDEQQPTGAPDPDGVVGLELPNPGAVLTSYDASVTAAIEERLPLESGAIALADGRQVLAFRVPNSTRKPHSVQYQGHIYFPARRERQRYAMSVREIKEIAMRTASRVEQAERSLETAFLSVARQPQLPYMMIGLMPVFSEDFLIDVRRRQLVDAVANFSRRDQPEWRPTTYTFHGIERRETVRDYVVELSRDGLLILSKQVPVANDAAHPEQHAFVITAIDATLRRFVWKARTVCEVAGISGPYVLGMMLRTQQPLTGVYGGVDGYPYNAPTVLAPSDYRFPHMQVDDLSEVDRLIRPLCDQAHQAFGLEGSPSFDDQGVWIGRYA